MNKFRNFSLIIFIFCSSFLFGQNNKIQIGLETGPGLKSLRGNDFLNNEQSIGFSAGLAFQYDFTRLMSFRTNISYERKGTTQRMKASDANGNPIAELTAHSNFDYITIPLLARFTYGDNISFFVNVGPYFGYLLKQEDIIEAYGTYPKTEKDNTDNFNKLDLGISSGLGVNFPILDNLSISLELRNNLGLKDLSALPVINGGGIKVNSINLLVGVAYRFGA